ncbi:MAG: alpha/beta hydrolase [Defluviitaleaceae bacterium]|nr:alpha/beta hydrolase [Defluviitaleaceae bacterium]
MLIFTKYLDEDKSVSLTCYIQEPSQELPCYAKKPAVLVLPGGAYLFTSDREAEPVALAYAAKGFQAFVLRYSTAKRAEGLKPLHEASKAIGLIRQNAKEWHVIADNIITCGFSAGGHLSAWVGLCGENKPNGMVLCYPALEFAYEEVKEGERGNPILTALLGKNYDKTAVESLNLAQYVGENSVPMFCWSTAEDVLTKAAPVLNFAKAYADFSRPFELHLYQWGEHGLVLGDYTTANGRKSMVEPRIQSWVDMSVEWFHRNFGEPLIEDKPHVIIPGLVPSMD